MDESELQPVRQTRKVLIIVLGGIFAALAVMLVIAMLLGDPTNGLGENQPTPSPESPASS
jgi:hypothetical protein